MTITKTTLATSVLGLVVAGALPAVAATTGYSLGSNGTVLVRMNDLTTPGVVTGVDISDDVILNALAYRPNTDQLYGFSQNTGTVYLVDRSTGQTSSVATVDPADPGIGVGEIGFDFNNVLDAARLVSTDDDNLVFFPDTAPPDDFSRATPLAYNPGDPATGTPPDENVGQNPSVFANAYTNQVPMPEETVQYALDSELDILAILDNNAGTLNTIGQISVDGETPLDFGAIDFASTGGFDIFSTMVGDNTGYALLTTVDGEGLYRFDSFELGDSGFIEAAFLGSVSTEFGLLDGLAVFDEQMQVAPIPLPASALLLGGAMAGFGMLRRRKPKSAA